ncbi:MAG: polysaccharide deacetylase family protein [Nitrospirae bacterium]|nr:polysaccharide deacetylase family protein [Nitrospirota bacterium]MCL5978079.1 polysaccharide deacetylase family protein [Nitrospirota bacterium]
MPVDMNSYLKILKLYGVYYYSPTDENNRPFFPESQQGGSELAARKLLSKPLSIIPEGLFLAVTKTLKASLQKGHKEPLGADHPIEKIIKDNRIPNKGLWFSRPRPLVLTHDVDLDSCFKNIKKVASIENSLGVSSTWHFLTNGRYKLERPILNELVASGHEIGLHGVWHDIALGFRSPSFQTKMIKEGLHEIAEYKPISFRAPGLAWTPTLSEILADSGIRADSSLRNYNGGWDIFRPMPINNGKLWELPLTLQDDYLLKNLRLGEKDAGLLLLEALDGADRRQAPAVLNFHPSIIKDHLDWYKETLKKILDSGRWKIIKVSDIIKQLDEAWREVR